MSSLRMRMPLSTNRSVATAHSSNSNVRQPLRLTPLRLTRRNLAAIIGVSGLVGPLTGPRPALARRLEGVNKPELLPKEKNKVVIDVAGFLSEGQEKRITTLIEGVEKDTGVKLRLLTQNYPETPGLAIKDYWGVDDDTVVFVADPSFGKSGGNILNFNIGTNVDLQIPPNFWSRLSGKYGATVYWQNSGEDAAIENAVSAIATCAREPPGKLQCSKVQGAFGEDDTSGKWGDFFSQKST
mmetsp:Transcript_13999/g.35040  ORF Transcript_13999/g.35040 Transcript_13999/m.35040 type:complete len:240 (-) Transcript_13999:67-786(-)